jgi:hypothetical protein
MQPENSIIENVLFHVSSRPDIAINLSNSLQFTLESFEQKRQVLEVCHRAHIYTRIGQ